MRYQHSFDITTLAGTWLQNTANLPRYIQIPGYHFYYKNRHERRGAGVGVYVKDTVPPDVGIVDETIKHVRKEFESKIKIKIKNYLIGVFYQPCAEDKRKTNMDSEVRHHTLNSHYDIE